MFDGVIKKCVIQDTGIVKPIHLHPVPMTHLKVGQLSESMDINTFHSLRSFKDPDTHDPLFFFFQTLLSVIKGSLKTSSISGQTLVGTKGFISSERNMELMP